MRSDGPTIPTWSGRQVIEATLIVVLGLFAFYLAYRFADIFILLFSGIVFSTALHPGMEWLRQRGLSRPAGITLIYTLVFVLLIGLGVLVLPLLADQVVAISAEMPGYYQDMRTDLYGSGNLILQQIAARLPTGGVLASQNQNLDPEKTIDQVGRSIEFAGGVLHGALQLGAFFILAFYWTLERERLVRTLLMWLPVRQRRTARALIDEIQERLSGFLIGQTILCLIIGAVSLAVYTAIGLPYSLVLAIIAGLMEAIPIVGPALGALPALLVAFSIDPAKAGWVAISAVAIQALENYLLVPRVMRRSVGVNPIVVMLSLTAFGSLFGLIGALMAIPLAAVLQILINHNLTETEKSNGYEAIGRSRFSVIRLEARGLAVDVRKQLRQKNTMQKGGVVELAEAIESLALDLDSQLSLIESQENRE